MSHTNATTQSLRHHTSVSSPLSITDTPKETFKQTRLYLLTRQPLTARNLEIHTSMLPSACKTRVERALQFIDRQTCLARLEHQLQNDLRQERRQIRQKYNLKGKKSSPSLHTITYSSCSSSIEPPPTRKIHRIMSRLSHPFQSRGTSSSSGTSLSSSSSSSPTLIAIGYHECI